MKIIENKEGKFKVSDNEIFLLLQPDPKDIYIKDSYIEYIEYKYPDFFKILTPKLIRRSNRLNKDSIYNGYTNFQVKKEFEIKGEKNDCLLFAERVSIGNPNYNDKTSVFSVSMGTKNLKFGSSDKNNNKIASYVRTNFIKKTPLYNLEVNPNIGDAYSIIPHDLPIDKGVCPYHVAVVIFKDNTTNITIEADAGIETKYPIFDMYSTSQHKYTFFASHMKQYLQYTFDKLKKLKFKLPTVLNLQKIYKEKINTKITEIKPTRKSSRLNPEISPNPNAMGKFKKQKNKKTKKQKNKKIN